MQKAKKPLFSVIMVDYEGSVPRETLRRGVECFGNQTFKNFELLIYHDGPKAQSYEDDLTDCEAPENVKFFETPERENNWGHSNRNRGIYEATGSWIIHTNADNIFYPFALQEMADAIESERWAFKRGQRLTLDWSILIFPIIMRGYAAKGKGFVRRPNHDTELAIILSGVPVEVERIDAMQLVMKRDNWISEGGWFDTSFAADGMMYEKFAKKYPIYQVLKILGEHW